MRYRLTPLYKAGAYGSVICLCLICGMITAQILGRMADKFMVWIGQDSLGLTIPGMSEISGFLLVGASFLGLSYTFVNGGHIRVTLLISHLSPRIRVYLELWCLTLALALCGFLAWYTFWLVEDSIAFNEVSYGILRIPLWIPQSGMMLGILLFCVALFEAWLQVAITAFTRPTEFIIDDSGHE